MTEEFISRKRLRPEGGFRTKRPVDKKIISVLHVNVGANDVATDLITATFPCTITGLRWNFAFIQSAGTGPGNFIWAIVIQRDGELLDSFSNADGSTLYSPEQNVLTWGFGVIDNNTQTKLVSGTTKSMRKLMGGDKYVFIMEGTNTDTVSLRGAVQFFCKT